MPSVGIVRPPGVVDAVGQDCPVHVAEDAVAGVAAVVVAVGEVGVPGTDPSVAGGVSWYKGYLFFIFGYEL